MFSIFAKLTGDIIDQRRTITPESSLSRHSDNFNEDQEHHQRYSRSSFTNGQESSLSRRENHKINKEAEFITSKINRDAILRRKRHD